MTYSAPALLLVGSAQNLVLGDSRSNGPDTACFKDSPNPPLISGSSELW
jgi:hypothetical protein